MKPFSQSVLALAAAAASVNSADLGAGGGIDALHLVIDITAITGTGPSLTVTIQGKDEVSGKYYTILASAALNAAGTTVLRVGRGLAVTANASTPDFIPSVWRVACVIAGTTPAVTATIAATVQPRC